MLVTGGSEKKVYVGCTCGSQVFTLERKTFSNGTHHVSAHCATCSRYVQFIPQTPPTPNLDTATIETMPFGKHRGKKLSELPGEYLLWGAQNLDNKKFKAAFEAELKRRA